MNTQQTILRAASVVGNASDTRWGQVFQTPQAYAVVEVQNSEGDARNTGIALLSKLTDALESPPASTQELSAIADALMDESVTSLLLLVPQKDTVYVASRGDGKVYLLRNTALALLTDGERVISGTIKPEDALIMASGAFCRTLSASEIVSAFDHLPAEAVAQNLTARLYEQGAKSGGAALILRAEPVHIQPTEEPAVPPARKESVAAKIRAFGRAHIPSGWRLRIKTVWRTLRQRYATHPKRLIALVVIVLFLISVALGVRKQYQSAAETKSSAVLAQATHAYEEGLALLDLNPVKGRERLSEAKDILASHVTDTPTSDKDRAVNELYQNISKSLSQAMHISEVSPELYYDLSLLKSGAAASDMAIFENTLALLDTTTHTVFTLDAGSKKARIVGGGKAFTDAREVAIHGFSVYVLTTKGIHEITLEDQKTHENVIPLAPEWGAIEDMSAFAGNIYLLDTRYSRIWKYLSTDKQTSSGATEFSPLYEYLNPDTLPDLSAATNMQIDGSVWIGTSVGVVKRFSAGKEVDYVVQGMDESFGATVRAYSHDDTDMVYILDQNRSRIVVFDKDGLYVSQYVWDASFAPSQFVVSETLGKILLLREGKIYAVNLR